MHIGVIGGGSIGLLVAAYARKAGFQVTVFTRTEKQQKKLNEDGLVLKRADDVCESFSVDASSSYAKLQEVDFLFIAVKQYDLETVLAKIQTEISHIPPVAFLQNGMSHLSLLQNLGKYDIFVAIVEHGALRENETTVIHTGKGKIIVGRLQGEMTRYLSMFQKLTDVGLNITVNDDWLYIMQKKLLANVCINPLTAMYRVKNGQLIKNKYLQEAMHAIFLEAVQILNLEKSEHELWEYVTSICEKTSANRSSMLRDLELQKATEIDAICGYLLDVAKKRNIRVSLTPFIYKSLKGLEIERRDMNE